MSSTSLVGAVLILSFHCWVSGRAQDSLLVDRSVFDQLYTGNDTPLPVTLSTDLRALIKGKYEEEDQPATLSYQTSDGRQHHFGIKIKARGNARKQVCNFPPLQLNFVKEELEAAGLARQYDKVKLVVQCMPYAPADEYIWREYLAYRLYNRISPYSFRVRAVQLTLADSRRRKARRRQLAAFLIEPAEELAERFSAEIVEQNYCRAGMLERDAYLAMAVFQYMIGNTDWYTYNTHNLQLLNLPEYEGIVPVPYDFDYAGLVNTEYAVPHHSLPISNVRERFYQGEGCEPEELDRILGWFKDQEEAILDYCRNFPLLHEKDRKSIVTYLNDFFRLLEDEEAARSVFGKKQ